MDTDGALAEIIEHAQALGIPLSRQIDPHVRQNTRAVSRFGCCTKADGKYIIEVSARLLDRPDALRETLAHELLHTCVGCGDHGARWKQYAARMNAAYGYHIARTGTWAALGMPEQKPVRHLLRCNACGLQIPRAKASSLVQHPERYRCKCGGTLRLEY